MRRADLRREFRLEGRCNLGALAQPAGAYDLGGGLGFGLGEQGAGDRDHAAHPAVSVVGQRLLPSPPCHQVAQAASLHPHRRGVADLRRRLGDVREPSWNRIHGALRLVDGPQGGRRP